MYLNRQLFSVKLLLLHKYIKLSFMKNKEFLFLIGNPFFLLFYFFLDRYFFPNHEVRMNTYVYYKHKKQFRYFFGTERFFSMA